MLKIFNVISVFFMAICFTSLSQAETDPAIAKVTGECLGIVSSLYKKRDALKNRKPAPPFVLSEALDKERDLICSKSTNKMDAEMEFIATKGHSLVQACVQAYTNLANRCGAIEDPEKSKKCGDEHSNDVFASMERHSPFLKFVLKK